MLETIGRIFLKKNQNAPRPSEHPPVMGKKCQNVFFFFLTFVGLLDGDRDWSNRFPFVDILAIKYVTRKKEEPIMPVFHILSVAAKNKNAQGRQRRDELSFSGGGFSRSTA